MHTPPARETYIIAVSGGVDSVVLLHVVQAMISGQQNALTAALASCFGGDLDVDFVIAHFDHGIREDSRADALFVSSLAVEYGMKFASERQELGSSASEALARHARYDFLERTRSAFNAKAIITAHHLDDRLETAVVNMLRGTGPRGLCSLRSTRTVLRPFLDVDKSMLLDYAAVNQLLWREDSTNFELKYRRNYIRHKLMPRLHPTRTVLETCIRQNEQLYEEIDPILQSLSTRSRHVVCQLPFRVACELVAFELRRMNVANISRRLVENTTLHIRTSLTGRLYDIDKRWVLRVDKRSFDIVPRDTLL